MKRIACIVVILSVGVLIAMSAFSQESPKPAATEAAPAPAPSAKEGPAEPSELSIYGEVQGVNAGANSVSVQYYDYDSDEEKAIDLSVDKDTKIENAASLNDIKNGDWVDVMYITSDGKNVAKSILVEKEESVDETGGQSAPAELPEVE